METIESVFFEDPTFIYIVLGVAEVVLLALWMKYRDSRKLVYMIAPVVLAGAAWATARLVVTDREQIEINTRHIAALLEAGDIDGVGQYLDDKLSLQEKTLDRKDVLMTGKMFIEPNRIKSIGLNIPDFRPANRRCNMYATSVVEFETGELRGQKLALAWKVHWVQKDGRWVINEADYKVGLKYE